MMSLAASKVGTDRRKMRRFWKILPKRNSRN